MLDEGRTVQFHVRMRPSERERLGRIAVHYSMSMSEVLIEGLRLVEERMERENDSSKT